MGSWPRIWATGLGHLYLINFVLSGMKMAMGWTEVNRVSVGAECTWQRPGSFLPGLEAPNWDHYRKALAY